MSGTIFLTELSRKFGVCMLSVAQSVPYQFNHTVLTQFTCHCEPRKKQSLPRRPHTSPLPISLSGHGIQTMLSGPKIQTEIVWIFGPHPPTRKSRRMDSRASPAHPKIQTDGFSGLTRPPASIRPENPDGYRLDFRASPAQEFSGRTLYFENPKITPQGDPNSRPSPDKSVALTAVLALQ